MPNVTVFTRHRTVCPHRKKASHNKCHCPKYLHWYKGKLHRKSADTDSHEVAVRRAFELQQNLERTGTAVVGTISVDEAVAAYLTDKQSQQLTPATIDKLKFIFEKQFLPFCREHGVAAIDQVTLATLQKWRGTWTDGSLAASKKQERVRGFFRWLVESGWLKQNPAARLSRIKVTQTPTEWFTPEQFEKIEKTVVEERYGERLHTLILLMRWSGVAIRDAVTLERSRLDDDDGLFLYRAKTGTPVSVTLPPDVAQKLRFLPNENPKYFFWSGKSLPKSAVSDFQRALRRVFERAGVNGKSHMFRNTFSVSLLMAGVPIHDVALLLGHSSVKTTEKHYAPFVMARRDNLLDAVQSAWNRKATEI